MDFLIAAALLAASFIVGVGGNLLASELYDRAPSLALWLVECALRRLPESERNRYREEWSAHLNDCESKLGKLWHAIGCYFAARSIRCLFASKHPAPRATIEISGKNFEMFVIIRGTGFNAWIWPLRMILKRLIKALSAGEIPAVRFQRWTRSRMHDHDPRWMAREIEKTIIAESDSTPASPRPSPPPTRRPT